MSSQIVRITRNLDFAHVKCGDVPTIDAYKTLVKEWIIGPAKILAEQQPRNTDHGMAIWALELMFFEPHGQFLDHSLKGSRKLFCLGFDRFRNFLTTEGKLSPDTHALETCKLYKWARCGLFHSSIMANELLVDAVGHCGKPLAKNSILNGWLVDPWLLLGCLDDYLDTYVTEVKSNENSELARNFEHTFEQLFSEPIRRFTCGN